MQLFFFFLKMGSQCRSFGSLSGGSNN